MVQPKEGDDVSSGKAAASGRVEVMNKRIARQEVRLAWGHDCAAILGSDSAGPTSHSVGAEMQTESHLAPVVGGPTAWKSKSNCRFALQQDPVHLGSNCIRAQAQLGVRFASGVYTPEVTPLWELKCS